MNNSQSIISQEYHFLNLIKQGKKEQNLGCKDLDTTKHVHACICTHTHTHTHTHAMWLVLVTFPDTLFDSLRYPK